MKEQSNGVPAALPTLLRAVEAEQASGCAAAEAARVEHTAAGRRWRSLWAVWGCWRQQWKMLRIGAERRGAL